MAAVVTLDIAAVVTLDIAAVATRSMSANETHSTANMCMSFDEPNSVSYVFSQSRMYSSSFKSTEVHPQSLSQMEVTCAHYVPPSPLCTCPSHLAPRLTHFSSSSCDVHSEAPSFQSPTHKTAPHGVQKTQNCHIPREEGTAGSTFSRTSYNPALLLKKTLEKNDLTSNLERCSYIGFLSNSRTRVFKPMQFVIILCSIACFGFTDVMSQGVVGTIPRCETEGEVIFVPGITNNRCTCKCMNNEVICDPDKCRTKPVKPPSSCDSKLCRDVEGCRVILFPPGPCCKVCKGCRYRKVQYDSGDTWRDHRDPCKQFNCQAGVVTISKVQCFTHCHNSLSIPGQCCPVCKGCFFRGKTYNESETFQLPTDICTTCTCKEGNIHCERVQCPVLNCKSDYVYQPKTECCPKCKGTRTVFDPRGCLFADHVYTENQQFSPEPCTRCQCRKRGTTVCEKVICPPLDCPLNEQVPMNNSECCKQCQLKRDCLFEGNGYKHKEEWRANICMQCSCVDGVTYCQREKCTNSLWCPQGYKLLLTEKECCPKCIEHDAVCSVFGDPHYRTFDGLMYSFQGTCKYILARDCVNNDFVIKVKNAVRFSSGFAWTQMLVVFVFNHRVSMLQNSVVKVDKVRAKLPYVAPSKFSIYKEGTLVKMKVNIGLEVTWDGDSFLEVTVTTKYKYRMCGLCGNYNGIKSDDLIGRDGTMYMSGQQFGSTWRVGSKSACHTDADKIVKAPCEMNSTARIRAQQACKIFYSQSFAKCRSKVAIDVYVSSCITDMCDCPPDHSCACEAILAYVSQCSRAGVNVTWYKPSSCLV